MAYDGLLASYSIDDAIGMTLDITLGLGCEMKQSIPSLPLGSFAWSRKV